MTSGCKNPKLGTIYKKSKYASRCVRITSLLSSRSLHRVAISSVQPSMLIWGGKHRVLGLKICRFEEISGNAGTAATCGTDGCIFLRFERLQGRRSPVLCLWAVEPNVGKPPPGRGILADQIRSLTSLTLGQISRAFGFVRMTLTAGPLRSLP